ncbi:MAG: trigger factor [Holosporaceae bacterium]|jgi:trigger factor|nr:trigger factor [Holosporaceae bacterium]
MRILSNTKDGLKRCYNVLISKEELEVAADAKLQEAAKKAKLDGFRPGKVPVDIVKRMYGSGIVSESKEEAIKNAAKQVIKDERLMVMLSHSVKVVRDDEEGLEFAMQLEVNPVFELKDLSGIELKKYVVNIGDEYVSDELARLRKIAKKWIEGEETDEVKDGCKVVIDLITAKLNKKKKSKEIKDVEIVVKETIDEYELSQATFQISKSLIGAKVSDVRIFNMTGSPNSVECKACVKKIFNPSEHQLDDDFAKDIGFKTLEEVKEVVKSNNAKRCEGIAKGIMRRDLLDKISDMYDFPIPEGLIQVETKEVIRQISEEARKIGKKFTPQIEEECSKIAEKRVRLGFVIAEIAKKENIIVSSPEITEAIRSIANMYPGKEETIWDTYTRREALPVVIGPILEKKVVDFLLEKIKISEEVACSYEKLIEIDEEPFDFFKDDVAAVSDESTDTATVAEDAATSADEGENENRSEESVEVEAEAAEDKKTPDAE